MATKGAPSGMVAEDQNLTGAALLDDAAASLAVGPADLLVADSDFAFPPSETDGVLLQLDDLLPDASGEVVLFAESASSVNLIADVPLADSGIADPHVTATGLDVTGLHFYSFESGITVYSPSDLLILDPGAA